MRSAIEGFIEHVMTRSPASLRYAYGDVRVLLLYMTIPAHTSTVSGRNVYITGTAVSYCHWYPRCFSDMSNERRRWCSAAFVRPFLFLLYKSCLSLFSQSVVSVRYFYIPGFSHCVDLTYDMKYTFPGRQLELFCSSYILA